MGLIHRFLGEIIQGSYRSRGENRGETILHNGHFGNRNLDQLKHEHPIVSPLRGVVD